MAELSFSVNCRELPYDHAYELSSEILNLGSTEIKNDNRNCNSNTTWSNVWQWLGHGLIVKIFLCLKELKLDNAYK